MATRYGDTVVFDRWDGGEYGRMHPSAAARAEKQMFTGTNVVRYRTGLIGPRPGLKAITIASMPTGTIQGLGLAVNTSGTGPWFWVCIGGSFYRVDVGAGTVSSAYTGTGPATIVRPLADAYAGTTSYVAVQGDAPYLLNHVAASVTAITSDADGSVIAWYDVNNTFRLFANSGNRVFFSSTYPGWTTWDPASYFDVGTALEITGLAGFRDGILISKASGEQFIYSGVPGATVSTAGTIRRLSKAGGPRAQAWGLTLEGNMQWYIGHRKDFPSSFNGALHADLDWLNFTGGVAADDSTVTPGFRFLPIAYLGVDTFMVLSGQTGTGAANRVLEYSGGIFTYHTWGTNIDPWGVCLADNAAEAVGQSTKSMLLGKGSTGAYYHYSPGLDRPGFTGDTLAQPGDASTTPLNADLGGLVHWSEDGSEIRPAEIVVLYRGWNTGSATNNGFKVQVTSLNRSDPTNATLGALANTEQTVVDIAGTSFSTSGTDARAVVIPTELWGTGFQVDINDLRGVAIDRVFVRLDSRTRP